MQAMRTESSRLRARVGLRAFAVLAVLTVVEWIAATRLTWALAVLVPVALVKAWVILDAFMHVRQLRHAREG